MKRRSGFIFILTALAFIKASAAFAEAPPSIPESPIPQNFGVNIHFIDDQLPAHIYYLKQAGIGWVRRDIEWAEVERSKGVYDFSAYDRLIDALHDAGIRTMMILDFANSYYDDGNSPASPEARDAFTRFCVAAVKRYAGKVDVWEIYNEPNFDFWKPAPDVEQYIAMADEVTAAIRAAVPEAVIVGPALAGPYVHDMPLGEKSPPLAYLDRVLASDAAHSWSAITIHPYRPPDAAPETSVSQMNIVRAMMRDHDIDPDTVPIIAGEWGYSTFTKGVDEETQAAYAVRYLLLAGIEHMPFTIWYDWQDDGTDNDDREHRFGLLHYGTLWIGSLTKHSIKPSYTAVQQLAELLKGYRFDALIEDDASIMVARYMKGGKTAYAAWAIDNASHTASLPLPPGRWRMNPLLERPKDLTVTAGQNASVTVDKMPVIILPPGN